MFKNHFAVAASVFLLTAAFAQQPAAPGAATQQTGARPALAALQVPNPHYVSVPLTIDVNAPVDRVWARVGKYCDVGEWLGNNGVTIPPQPPDAR